MMWDGEFNLRKSSKTKKRIFWYFSEIPKFGKEIVSVFDIRHSWFDDSL